MPMEEVVRAHTMMEKNEQVGKIVLTMEWIVCCEKHFLVGGKRVLYIDCCWDIGSNQCRIRRILHRICITSLHSFQQTHHNSNSTPFLITFRMGT